MSLAPNTRLGPYEILSPLGAGGMGEVYRARDSRLDRDVAIKVLPEQMARDKERALRFEREAKLLATLNHPHIAAIHGFEESNGKKFLVLEFVEGETLSQRIKRGPLPIEEALEIGKQVAEAVEAAHEKGVIHRDLKPANVIVRPDGTVKVLDFGLARAMADEASGAAAIGDSPTITTPAVPHSPSIPGVILGTAAYMSPEQARGRAIDRRTDIWSFGVVLYECLTGVNPFLGETVSDSIGAILHKGIDLNRLPVNTPPMVRHVLRRCLERDRSQRLRDLGDARIELEHALSGTAPIDFGLQPTLRSAPATSTFARMLPWAVAGMALAAFLFILFRRPEAGDRSTTTRIVRFAEVLAAPRSVAISDAPVVAISPDGKTLAYVSEDESGRRIYVRRLDRSGTVPLAGTENARYPFFSPDGKWLGFAADRAIKKVALDGGVSFTVAAINENIRGAGWAPDGSLIYATGAIDPLVRLAAAGGAPTPVTSLDVDKNERTHRWVQVLPSGEAAIYTVGTLDSPENYDDARIEAVRFRDGSRKKLFTGASMARYMPGYLLCAKKGTVMAMPFDADKLEVTGEPFPALTGVLMTRNSGAAHFAVAGDGTLVYVPGEEATSDGAVVVANRAGQIEDLGLPPAAYVAQALSPDGTRLALIVEGQQANDIWVARLADRVPNRLTFEGQNMAPAWRPNGEQLAFGSARAGTSVGLYLKAADGGGQEQLLYSSSSQLFPCSWTPDGKTLLFEYLSPGGRSDLWMVGVDPPGTAEPLMEGPELTRIGQVSPNGRWLAFESDESGRSEIYVRSFPGPGGKWQVSRGGGREPRWAQDGRELYYPNDDFMMVVSVDEGESFRHGAPTTLFRGYFPPVTGAGVYCSYSVSPDGQSFYMIRPSQGRSAPQINVVINWGSELRH